MPAKPPDIAKARHGLDLIELFEQPHGKALQKSIEDVYAEMLAIFTKRDLTIEQVKTQYDQLQGFLALLVKMGLAIEDTKFLIEKHQQVAKEHMNQTGVGEGDPDFFD